MVASIRAFVADSPPADQPPTQPGGRRRAWAPTEDDQRIYQWFRFDGKSQGWIAAQVGISQATVSRVIQRYERWKAHADPRDGGQLDPAERARTQRWLTYERNERILAAALRIADEVEGSIDVSKSTTRRPFSDPSQESEIRTEWSRLDRTGTAARFLRLAFRINMEQQKLVSQEPAPMPQPLTDEELAEQEAQAAAAWEELRAARQASRDGVREQMAADLEASGQWEALRNLKEAAAEDAAAEAADAPGPRLAVGVEEGEVDEAPQATAAKILSDETPGRVVSMQEVNNLHNGGEQDFAATNSAAATCGQSRPPAKNSEGACIRRPAIRASTTGRTPPIYSSLPEAPDEAGRPESQSVSRQGVVDSA